MYTGGHNGVSEGSLGAANSLKVGGWSAGGSSYGVLAPPELLAQAKSGENRRSLRARDPARPGPNGPAK